MEKDIETILKASFEKYTDYGIPLTRKEFLNKFNSCEYEGVLYELMFALGMFTDVE